MTENHYREYLYLTEATRYEERVLEQSRSWSSGKYVVVAERKRDAERKLLGYLKSNTRYRTWKICLAKRLTAGTDLPLEKRLEILGEVFKILPQ